MFDSNLFQQILFENEEKHVDTRNSSLWLKNGIISKYAPTATGFLEIQFNKLHVNKLICYIFHQEDLQVALLSIWRQVGWPLRVHSDNGTNYVSVRSKLLSHKPPSVPEFVWTTSTPYGPWMIGLAERLVRISKECLVRFNQAPRSHL